MRIKWNRQLDGSLTNRPADGSELPSKEESHQNAKSHNSPKFFRIFRRKKRRQLPEDPTENSNSEAARPCSQAPSEVDESDCASISSAATIASQPVTEVCHRDRTLSLFSSFRRSLPGGRRKSKRTVLPAPPDPLFHVEELENNRYSSPDLRKGKLESYHETKEFSKSSTFVGKACDSPANTENAQSLDVLRAETSKSFGQLKSEGTQCARQESKLSKSVSFSDCQTRASPSLEKSQPVNDRCDRKGKSLVSKHDSHSSETSCPNSVPKSTSNGPCLPLFLPAHQSIEEVLHKSEELATAVNVTRDHPMTEEIHNFKKNSNSGKDFSEKKMEVISDAKKKYFSHRIQQKHNKISFSQIESDHDVNILKPNGDSIACHNNSFASDHLNSVSKKSFSPCEKSNITSELSVISDRNENVVNHCKPNHVPSVNILKRDDGINHKNVLLNSMGNFDSVVPNALKSDHAMIINSHPSKSFDKQEEESLKCDIVSASNVWVDSSLPDTIKEICDELLAMKTGDYSESPIKSNSIIEDIRRKEPLPVNGHTHVTDTCLGNKVSHVSFTSSDYSKNLVSEQDEIYDNVPCELIETAIAEKSVSFELPNRKTECKQQCLHLDALNNTEKFKLSDNYLNINENEFNLSSVGSCDAESAQESIIIPEINVFMEENNSCNKPETINKSTFEVSNCKMSDFDMPWCKNRADSHNILYREKNQERCPSYYSMSVGPAGSGVTLSESDLLEEINDTAQFSENKGGSISTENNVEAVESAECPPKMLSNIEFSPENFRIDTIAALMSKDAELSRDLLCESAPKIGLYDDAREMSDYSKHPSLQSEKLNEIDYTSSKVCTNAKSVRLEISSDDAEHSINPVQEMLTPVLSEYSDYFSMQDESSSVGTHFTSIEVISANRETSDNYDRLTDVSSYPFDPTSTSISFPASPSPESIEFDESLSCDLRNVSDMFSDDVNHVDIFSETTECKVVTTETPNSCVTSEKNQRHIKAPTVHFAGHTEPQRSRKKYLTDKDGMSLIPSLKKNKIKTCDKKSVQTPDVKIEIPDQNVYSTVNRHDQEECNVLKEYVENYHKNDSSKEYSVPVDFREKKAAFVLKEFLHQDLLEREADKSSLSKYKSEELFVPSNTDISLEKIKNRRNSTSQLTYFNINRENAYVELQEVPCKVPQLENLPINNVEMTPKDHDKCESFCTVTSSNATLDNLSDIYSNPHNKRDYAEGHPECGLQTRCSSLPAVVGQPSPLKELPNDQQVNGPIKDKDVPCRKSRIPRKLKCLGKHTYQADLREYPKLFHHTLEQTGVRGTPHSTKPVRPPMWLSKAELTQEIQRLGTLCEARTKELNRLKMETKHVSVGFDAFAALFKYMVEDLNALSIPVLSGDLEKTLKQLELAKQDLAYYEREVEEMKAHHSQELNDLSNKLFEVYQGEITELSIKHQEELNQLNYDHQIQIESLSTAMKASSDEVQAKYELMISQLKQELTTQREELQLFQDREIKDLEEKHAQATKTLQEHIEQLQKKCAELNKHSMSMEDAMRKDTDTKLQWVTSRKIDLEKEVESLKAVLEMKNKELHSLRVQTLEMEKQLEDLPLAREKIKMLQARAEDLEALMIEKTKLERKLSTENQMLKDTYEKESKVNKRLSMENEELQWRIRQAENSLLSGSFSEVAEYPESVENGTVSPIKSPTAPQMSRSVFFTFIDKDDNASQSPRSQYKKITPGFANNYKTSPGKTNSASSPRRAKSHSEPPQPPTLSCTPRKMTKQFSSKQKSTPKRQRSGSDCGRSTSDHAEVNFSSVTGSMASSVSSESSVFEHKEQLLEEHEEQIMETLQILHEQRSIESPVDEPLTPNTTEKEWCNGEAKDTSMSPDFGNEDMSRSSEFSDPKTYYHMTFPVPKETGIVDCDSEDAAKNASEESTPSLEEPVNIIHSMSKSDLTQVFNNASLCSLEELSENVNVTTETVSVDNMQSTQSVSHTELQEQQKTI